VRVNESGEAIGDPVPGWTARSRPPRTPLDGRYCRVEPLDAERHLRDLYDANAADAAGRNWTYLGYGPFSTLDGYRDWFVPMAESIDPLFHAIVDADSDKATGVAAYLRIDPPNGVIEVGHLNFSPRLQGTRAATEAMFLMMRRAFDELGYRRYEWKCDSLNARSRRAAVRLGFVFEGLFRQATVYKGRNRDTAWYSIVDREWPAVAAAFEHWLNPANFDANGNQRERLSDLTRAVRSRVEKSTDDVRLAP
jgi:RimJ/RimL family protein N-acetyltransferase